MVDDILSDNSMERMDRIERLESILAAASQHALHPLHPAASPSSSPSLLAKVQGSKVNAETQVKPKSILFGM